MATSCTIGYINKSGEYQNIYCHFDGGLEFTGKILFEKYKKFKDVDALINLGNLNFLADTLEKTQVDKQPFNQPNEPNREFNYLFKNNQWFYRNNVFLDGKWIKNSDWIKLEFKEKNLNVLKNNNFKKIKISDNFDYGI